MDGPRRGYTAATAWQRQSFTDRSMHTSEHSDLLYRSEDSEHAHISRGGECSGHRGSDGATGHLAGKHSGAERARCLAKRHGREGTQTGDMECVGWRGGIGWRGDTECVGWRGDTECVGWRGGTECVGWRGGIGW
jgi:hypothetical protein